MQKYSLSQLDVAFKVLPDDHPLRDEISKHIEEKVDEGTNADGSLRPNKAKMDRIQKGRKGSGAPIGSLKEFGGRQYIKTATGWKYHGKGTGVKAQAHAAGSKMNSGELNTEIDHLTKLRDAARPQDKQDYQDAINRLVSDKNNLQSTSEAAVKTIETILPQEDKSNVDPYGLPNTDMTEDYLNAMLGKLRKRLAAITDKYQHKGEHKEVRSRIDKVKEVLKQKQAANGGDGGASDAKFAEAASRGSVRSHPTNETMSPQKLKKVLKSALTGAKFSYDRGRNMYDFESVDLNKIQEPLGDPIVDETQYGIRTIRFKDPIVSDATIQVVIKKDGTGYISHQ